MATTKGFIKDWQGNRILPITRGELVLDQNGIVAFQSEQFLANADGNGLPGLITAAERAMLSGGSAGTGITDIYNKLGYINTGLQFNNTTLNYYNESGQATPIKITSDTTKGITIGIANNVVSLSLTELTTSGLSASSIVKSITIDKFGRVTAVSGSALTNDEIPDTLTEKTLTSSTLSGCVTSETEIGDNEKAVANKAYVDAKFQIANSVATGALKFGGSLSDASIAIQHLSDSKAYNSYYKVIAPFELSTSYLYDTSGITQGLVGNTLTVAAGDTLIVYPQDGAQAKYVYIPSANDITTLTVKDPSTTALSKAIDHVTLSFSSLFSVGNPQGSNTATITLKQVTDKQDGYLSSTDYNEFKAYAQNLAVGYTSEFTSGTNVYKIGTLTVGNNSHDIYGKNNISALTLDNGTTSEYNPILKFTEDGVDTKITIQGSNGIVAKKDGNTVILTTANTVDEDSANYISITQGHKFGVKLGSVDASTGTVTEGLVNYSTVYNLATKVAQMFEVIDYTLIGTDSTKYQYGNEKLKTAITLTI